MVQFHVSALETFPAGLDSKLSRWQFVPEGSLHAKRGWQYIPRQCKWRVINVSDVTISPFRLPPLVKKTGKASLFSPAWNLSYLPSQRAHVSLWSCRLPWLLEPPSDLDLLLCDELSDWINKGQHVLGVLSGIKRGKYFRRKWQCRQCS